PSALLCYTNCDLVYTSPHTLLYVFFFSFNDTATTDIYTLSLHDALPISAIDTVLNVYEANQSRPDDLINIIIQMDSTTMMLIRRSEEHTSELQSRFDLVCRLLLEKKKKKTMKTHIAEEQPEDHTIPDITD